jgi:hypothetical protein
VQGNFIGTDAGGTLPLPNDGSGVSFFDAAGNTVGGTAPGAGNVIAFNLGSGVALSDRDLPVNANAILGNSIFDNQDLGIDLAEDGVTPNDAGDADTGVNELQNFPVLTSVSGTPGALTVQGTLNSTPSSTFTVELFASSAVDPSGNGEGRFFLGSTGVTTDAGGNGPFTFNSVVSPINGGVLTATATDAAGNTSEFSGALPFGAADAEPPVLKNCTVSPRSLPSSGGTVNFSIVATDNVGVTLVQAIVTGGSNGPLGTSSTVITLKRQGKSNTFTGSLSVPPNTTGSTQTFNVLYAAEDAAGNSATEPCGTFQVRADGGGGDGGGSVVGSGLVDASELAPGAVGLFSIRVSARAGRRPTGGVNFTVTGLGRRVFRAHSVRLDSLEVEQSPQGPVAFVTGTMRVTGFGVVGFAVEALDGRDPGVPGDVFFLTLSDVSDVRARGKGGSLTLGGGLLAEDERSARLRDNIRVKPVP